MQRFLIALSIIVVGIAWYVNNNSQKHRQQTVPSLSNTEHHRLDESHKTDSTTIYAIGDLHGDADCAKQWVARTGVINNDVWVDSHTHLVFVGDYCDKGIQSKQVMEYVMSLTEQFPHHVHAILGNHEVELLRDRTEKLWNNATFYQLAYSTLHPAEYLNYLPQPPTPDDFTIIEHLYNASLQVYGRGLHRSARFVPDYKHHAGSILWLVPEPIRDIAAQRLQFYQESYINAFKSSSKLGKWLEERPIAVVVDGSLFVHGGWPPTLELSPDEINALFKQHANETYLGPFLQTPLGRHVYDVVTYRGNHKSRCDQLVLPDSIQRLIVGHTPAAQVRTACSNRFVAIDSALSRWFRNSGNDYCYGTMEQRYGSYTCDKKSEHCEGEIVRIRGNRVDILTMQ